jgi:DNA-3-methyladenine glycosylase II
MKDALAHLKRDKVLKGAIKATGTIGRQKKDNDLYLSLMRAIVGQQLSVKAAATIWQRFLALFPDGYPSPQQVIGIDVTLLRSAGLSFQKAGYLKNIAEFSTAQTLDYSKLKRKTDEELLDYLVQIKGVGRWTAEMLLMFSLNRPDIFPVDDLGIQVGMRTLYNLKEKDKKRLISKMVKIAESWRPHRTLACMYVWKYKDAVRSKS